MSGNYVESKKMAKSSAGIAAQRISENNREIVSELEKINYDKAMIVELYRENYSSYDELAVCVNNMKKIYDKYKMGL